MENAECPPKMRPIKCSLGRVSGATVVNLELCFLFQLQEQVMEVM